MRLGTGVVSIVLNYAHPDDTIGAVESLQRSDFAAHSIVVVDNSKDPASPAQLREMLDPCVAVLAMGANLGYAAGNNAGIRFALERYAPEFVWVVNPDTVVAPNALAELVAGARRRPDAALLSSRLLEGEGTDAVALYDGASIDPKSGATTHLSAGKRLRDLPGGPPVDTGYASGAAMLIRCNAIPVIGLIPEDYFLYFEETDYAMRARRAGFAVVVAPDSHVTHNRRSWGELPTAAYMFYMVRNRLLFSRRWGFDLKAADAVTDSFANSWRGKVRANRPDLVAAFDEVVAAARADAAAGRVGHSGIPDELGWVS